MFEDRNDASGCPRMDELPLRHTTSQQEGAINQEGGKGKQGDNFFSRWGLANL